mmetsp:Transcript_33627/g.76124  ORF Transcript_33627/g.76124 Transcript_33627/m.76124 type:complete len:220 (-) Transcript_33627:220-879(-)
MMLKRSRVEGQRRLPSRVWGMLEACVQVVVLPVLPVCEYVARAHVHHQCRCRLRRARLRSPDDARDRDADVRCRGERKERAVGRVAGALRGEGGDGGAARRPPHLGALLCARTARMRPREGECVPPSLASGFEGAKVEACGPRLAKVVELRWKQRDTATARGLAQQRHDHVESVPCLPSIVACDFKCWDFFWGVVSVAQACADSCWRIELGPHRGVGLL